MPDTKISALSALTGANVATGDLLPLVDISDTTMAASGTDVNITADELAKAMATTLGVVGRDKLYTAAGMVAIGTGTSTATGLAIGTAAGKALVADPNATNKASIQFPQGVNDALMGVTGSLGATLPRWAQNSVTLAPLITQRLYLVGIALPKGITVTTITWYSGTTAAATSTNCWSCLMDSSRNQLAISADDTSASPWSASTAKAFTMTTPYQTTVAGFFYVGVMIKAGTVPTLEGSATSANTSPSRSASPVLAGLASNTGLTNPASCPNPAGAITLTPAFAYVEVS